MSGLNDPKDKKAAEEIAALYDTEPLAWNFDKAGNVVLVLVSGPKLTLTADQIETALTESKEPKSGKKGKQVGPPPAAPPPAPPKAAKKG